MEIGSQDRELWTTEAGLPGQPYPIRLLVTQQPDGHIALAHSQELNQVYRGRVVLHSLEEADFWIGQLQRARDELLVAKRQKTRPLAPQPVKKLLLSTKEAAFALATDVATIERLIDDRDLPFVAIGPNRKIPKNAIDDLVAESVPQRAKRLAVYTVMQAAQSLGVSPGVVTDLVRNGKLPTVTIGGVQYVPVFAFDRFVAGSYVTHSQARTPEEV